MTKKLKTVVFFGSGPVAAASLSFLAKHFLVETVITKNTPAHYKEIPPVEVLANRLDIPMCYASTKSELDEIFYNNKFDSDLGVIIDYGVMVSKTVIDSFRLGILNSHFSLLPEWRGADPITFSVLSGQSKTGVSLMLIEPSLDTGKLIIRKSLAISPDDTAPTLTDKLIELSNQLIADYLPSYMDGQIKPKNQPHPDRATYSRKLTKGDGLIDWTKSATQIEREIRAYSGWPKSYTDLDGKRIVITKAHVADMPNTILDFKCGDSKYLSVDNLIAPSGRLMSARDFLNGYKN